VRGSDDERRRPDPVHAVKRTLVPLRGGDEHLAARGGQRRRRRLRRHDDALTECSSTSGGKPRAMASPKARNNLVLLAIGLLVLLGPVAILAATLAALTLLGDVALGEITPVAFLELYVIDLVLFVGFGYGIYRLTLWLVSDRLPAQFDRGDPSDVHPRGDERDE
jgi:hypothetical protein